MSFKRADDDTNLLRNLQRHRVSELLSNHIPDDEALLIKNGRLACTVCYHRPVFDTLEMLAVHRKGKKHLANLSRKIMREEEIKELKVKKLQEQFVKTGAAELNCKPSTPQPTISKYGLLNAAPYSSCARRKGKPQDRKPTIDLVSESKVMQPTTETELPVNTRRSTSAVLRSYLKQARRRKGFDKLVSKSKLQYGAPISHTTATVSEEVLASETTTQLENQTTPEAPQTSGATPGNTKPSEEELKKAMYYKNLRMSGWKKDWNGQWVKDENAEFDSDEEQPEEYPG